MNHLIEFATFLISILSLLAAFIAAIYASVTYLLTKKMFKFSLFDKRYLIFKKFSDLLMELELYWHGGMGGMPPISVFENPSPAKMHFLPQLEKLKTESRYLFSEKITLLFTEGINLFNQLSKPNDETYKNLETYKEKLKVDNIKQIFDVYLFDKEFQKPEPYSLSEWFKNIFFPH